MLLEFRRILHSSVKSSCHADGWSQLQLGDGTSLQCVIGIGLLLIFKCCYSCVAAMTFILQEWGWEMSHSYYPISTHPEKMISASFWTFIKMGAPGRWVVQSVKHPMLDFSSGHDLAVLWVQPLIRLCTGSIEPPWDSLSPSVSASPTPVLSVSLSK